MAAIKRIGFGQVEPNHLSAQRTYQIYAQLPAHVKSATLTADSITQLENGQYVKYDYANGEVNFTGEGEWMLVYNEIKLYDERKSEDKYFALQTKDFTDGVMTPRVLKTNVGDIYTTNTLKAAGAEEVQTTMEEYTEGDHLVVNANGFLQKDTKTGSAWDTTTGMIWQVVKVYNLPDMQDAVKIMRIN